MTQATRQMERRLRAGCLAALLVTTFVLSLQAQEERPKAVKARVQLLENQVDQIDEKLREIYGANTPDYLRTRLIELQTKIDELAMQLSEVHEMRTALESAGQEQAARLDEVAEEVAALWKDIEQFKTAVRRALSRPLAGYDSGFFIQSIDKKFRLSLNGFVRPYYQLGLQQEWKTNAFGTLIPDENGMAQESDLVQENGFGLANTRLIIHAQILEVIHGEIEIDYGNLTGQVLYPLNARVGNARYNQIDINEQTLFFLDAYGEYAPIPEFAVRIGQFKVPFDQESLFDANELTFTSRSLMTRAYPLWGGDTQPRIENGEEIVDNGLIYRWDYEMSRAASFGRDRGLALHGRVADGMFNYSAGIFNGSGDNVVNDNRDMLIALRLSTEPAGPMTRGMSDLETTTDPLIAIGASFAFDLLEHKNAIDPLVVYNSSDVNLAVDAHFKWYGVSALAGLFYRHADHGAVYIDENGDESPIDAVGVMGQLAYFNEATGLEPGFRYSLYDADMDRKLDHVHEITVVIGYYPFAPYLKFSAQYRGLFPAQTTKSYLAPLNVWYDYLNEITFMAQVSF